MEKIEDKFETGNIESESIIIYFIYSLLKDVNICKGIIDNKEKILVEIKKESFISISLGLDIQPTQNYFNDLIKESNDLIKSDILFYSICQFAKNIMKEGIEDV